MTQTPDERSGARSHLGARSVRVAAHWLELRGYRLLARNWRCLYGELDLVAEQDGEQDGELVFVEVKTRRSTSHGAPEEASAPATHARLAAAAQTHLAEIAAPDDKPLHIDVLAGDIAASGAFQGVRHFPHAIGAEE